MRTSTDDLRLVVEIEVTDPDRFKELVAECVEISREEPGTLVYDWYLNDETNEARLYEVYESPEALQAHGAGRVFTEVAPQLLETCRFVGIQAFGDPEVLKGVEVVAPPTLWGRPFAILDG